MSWKDKIAYWLIPPGFKELRYDYKKRNANSVPGLSQKRLKEILKNNKFLKNKHSGARCFILCTGPSINEENLLPLKNEVTLACSRFYLHPRIQQIKPSYYIQPSWSEPIDKDAFVETLQDAAKNMPEAIAVTDIRNSKIIEENNLFCDSVYYYHAMAPLDRFVEVDLQKPTLRPQSVSIIAICCAIYMGCREIFLLGYDHSWVRDHSIPKHFYREEQAYYPSMICDVYTESKATVVLWDQYKVLREIAEKKGVAIYNATRNSLLDVFPKVDYESLFSK